MAAALAIQNGAPSSSRAGAEAGDTVAAALAAAAAAEEEQLQEQEAMAAAGPDAAGGWLPLPSVAFTSSSLSAPCGCKV